jgi:Arc/MetJ-type ribon-helix-helix transcriptional regulator
MTREDVAALDELVARGRFRNRSDALRAGFARILQDERESAIAEAYRHGYGRKPQESSDDGLAAFAAFDRAEGGEPL